MRIDTTVLFGRQQVKYPAIYVIVVCCSIHIIIHIFCWEQLPLPRYSQWRPSIASWVLISYSCRLRRACWMRPYSMRWLGSTKLKLRHGLNGKVWRWSAPCPNWVIVLRHKLLDISICCYLWKWPKPLQGILNLLVVFSKHCCLYDQWLRKTELAQFCYCNLGSWITDI